MITPSIFKAYDIRGIVDQSLTEEATRSIGLALGAQAHAAGVSACVVGRDGRLSGPRLLDSLAEGLMDAGIDVIDIGMVPTPVVYFATKCLETGTGVAVTGSHNPPEYNGLKMMVAGTTLYGESIQSLLHSIQSGALDAIKPAKRGSRRFQDVSETYLDRIVQTVKLSRPIKIAVDSGNGVAGRLGPELFRRLGCEVVELFCEIDGRFPNHHPDPAHPENLVDLQKTLAETDCELGLAFDGDGDRLGVVTKDGQIIWPDRQLMLYARDVLQSCPGAEIVFDVKCSRNVAKVIRDAGGKPRMGRTGHSLIKALLREIGAPLAGEMSGHVFFNDRWYGFDDGLYTGARLLEIVTRTADPSALLNALPNAVSTPELQIKMAEGENVSLCRRLQSEAEFEGAEDVITIDGVRVEYADGFGLARPSNTTPVVVCRFEADSEAALKRIIADFSTQIQKLAPGIKLPF